MAEWRFYGRDEELAELDFILELGDVEDRPRFGAYRIVGWRGVGKTELLKEAGRRGTRGVPVVSCELPSLAVGDAGLACRRLGIAANNAGLERVVETLPPRQPLHCDRIWFGEIVKHLIRNGAVVGLDEFHHAMDLGLESEVKLLIDGFSDIAGGRKAPGKLVLMGSHQQCMFRMFRSDRPLHQRLDSSVKLSQWQVPTVLEMAAEQGFLTHPGRFLTLWTAFGGVPRHWNRFATGARTARLRDFGAWPDDRTWRLAFLAEQRRILQDPEERCDNKAFIELAAENRDVLLWLARNRPRGARMRRFPEKLHGDHPDSLWNSLNVLRLHLELIEGRRPFRQWKDDWDPETVRWRLADNNTMFQIAVMRIGREAAKKKPDANLDDDEAKARQALPAALADLQWIEGYALERLSGGAMRAIHGVAYHSVEVAHDLEVDVLAESPEGGGTLWLGGCKRNAREHETDRLASQFDAFLATEFRDAERYRSMRGRRVLISPEFTAAQRAEYGSRGFECVGIRDMARMLGHEPEPGLEPAPEPAARPFEPDPDDTPSLDM